MTWLSNHVFSSLNRTDAGDLGNANFFMNEYNERPPAGEIGVWSSYFTSLRILHHIWNRSAQSSVSVAQACRFNYSVPSRWLNNATCGILSWGSNRLPSCKYVLEWLWPKLCNWRQRGGQGNWQTRSFKFIYNYGKSRLAVYLRDNESWGLFELLRLSPWFWLAGCVSRLRRACGGLH